jgi:putative oxygen-independent coproporphyrinogen III oxidase
MVSDIGSSSVVRQQSGLQTLPPLSLYVHLPWCLKKCPYCDFNSHAVSTAAQAGAQTVPEQRYLAALELDLETALPKIWGRSVQTIFIGGGTPSLFSSAAIGQLLDSIRARVKLAPDAEVTLEANPGTFEVQRFTQYAQMGVTRLSIGVQSFNDGHLHSLGRIHDRSQALNAAAVAKAQYRTWNLDLMYGLPLQTLEQALSDLDQALLLDPPHLSLYNLTLEPNTEFARRPPTLPDDDSIALMQERLEQRLIENGYLRYEVSAWAKPGFECRHNLNYWEFGDYLGIGAGAHSKLSFHDHIERQIRQRTPEPYMLLCQRGEQISQINPIATVDLPFEFMLNALRLVGGVTDASFAERTGVSLIKVQQAVSLAIERGLLEPMPGRFKATEKGLLFLNDLQALFLN